MAPIRSGDYVKHKSLFINGGLAMNVIEVEGSRALCEYFEGAEQIHKQTWFSVNDLEVVTFGDGGFKDAGE